jgi:tRNA 2-(methylsulfanyl)-N6-isopentenyladenosine37 hydroxylase
MTVRSQPGPAEVCLRSRTDRRWLAGALAQLDLLLVDHAHCEKKAAANALSLLQAYPEVPGLPALMARLAREESAHLARVLQLLEARGLPLGRDPGDPYAQGLQKLLRTPAGERRLDRLLVAAIIEARSCERLGLLAHGLEEPELRRFYAELARSEDGHQRLFLRLAERSSPGAAGPRLETLLEAEAELVRSLPLRPAIH